ncbi:uncharacterized protein [Diadema antillarum]|uniref:uncharacterized protein n=1 Tax=Diadema antillarum TaxID=105358 RepID=UPI003A88086F
MYVLLTTSVAICTPLMKRVHENIKNSGEMIFLDSSGNCDHHNSRIFVVLTHSSAGGLPLGMIIMTSESMPTIQAGFSLLQSILPERAFFGRGAMGPQVVMTDDCKALRQGLHAVYPQSSLILCVFHLMQALRRWLWDAHNQIRKQDRPYLLDILKKLIYANSSLELETRFQQILEDKVDYQSDQREFYSNQFETDSTYTVPSAHSEDVYHVNTNLQTRTCPKGESGGPCKHQYAGVKKFNVTNTNFLPTTTPHLRKLLYTIATGRDDVPNEWFANLHPAEQAKFPPDADEMMVASTSRDPQIERLDSLSFQRDPDNDFLHRGKNTQSKSLSIKLEDMFQTLRFKLQEDEESFHTPLTKFVERFEQITTDSALVSALSTFGKYSGDSLSKKARHFSQQAMLTSTKIGIHPTAVSRRKTAVGGRRALITGRPVKGTQNEHGYARHKGSIKRGVLPRSQRPAPHSLSQCVE